MDTGVKLQIFVLSYVRLTTASIASCIAEAAGRRARLAASADSHCNASAEGQLPLNQRAVVQGSAVSPITIFLALAAKNVVLHNDSKARKTNQDSHSSRKLPQVSRS